MLLSKKGYFSPPVVIILALIMFFVALVLYLNSDLVKNAKNSTQTTPPSSEIIKITSPDAKEIANWKVYTDDKLKFSIMYPTEISVRRTLSEGGAEFGKTKDLGKDFRQVNILGVYKRAETGNDPESVFKNSECPQPCNEKTQKVVIGNAIGIKTLGPAYPFEHNYYLTNQNKTTPVVRLWLFPNNLDPDQDTEVFAKMISTFRLE